ncbi:Asp-tRNA(Asn)/Glu-tRNA(Gln) amidotransferase subunit GatB [Candidatus Woesearchaeota archaeon]|nr:Asp-tRNA(Asn)/Glu-tRNA(Gln) amidotransferase subunit GatB [Candidatus Woesearchaeota archaeon]
MHGKLKVGLEVHGYLNSGFKLFCNCRVDANAPPNTTICPVCTSQPGSKPMLPYRGALDKIVAIALMLGCRLNRRLLFQRKHYSWPDLPAGYQRTISGSYSFPVGVDGSFLGIGICDVHLEEDPARWDPETGFVDYNRSGYPLVEIVTNPEFVSSAQVRDWLKKLLTTLSYIKAITPDAGIKCDVNVSVGPEFKRVEIKNVNSLKAIVSAIDYESRVQLKAIGLGKQVLQETKAWDDRLQETVFMRAKEAAMDYMFIPEPDLPVITITEAYSKQIESSLPEKPHDKLERYVNDLGVERSDAEVISSDILLAGLFEKVCRNISPVFASRWFRKELLRVMNYLKKDVDELGFDESHITQLLALLVSRKISDETGRSLIEKLAEGPFDVDKFVKEENLEIISAEEDIGKLCDEVIRMSPQAVNDYRMGESRSLNFLVGQVVARTRGRADARIVREIILKKL